MAQGVKSQLGGVGKGAVKQVLTEPLEILKSAGGQLGGEAMPTRPQNIGAETSQAQEPPQPSLDEKKKPTTLAAHRTELEEMIARERKAREQAAMQQQVVDERETQQVKQQEKQEKETIFQKGLKMVTGRLKRRMETRLPKAA